MQGRMILVRAIWDEAASVWVASSDDVPGLVTEADTLERVRAKVLIMIPELLDANNLSFDGPEIPVHFLAEQTARLVNPSATVVATP